MAWIHAVARPCPRSPTSVYPLDDALVTIVNASFAERTWPREDPIGRQDYLYGNTQRADQKPAADMYERLDVLVSELEQHKERLQRLIRMVTDG